MCFQEKVKDRNPVKRWLDRENRCDYLPQSIYNAREAVEAGYVCRGTRTVKLEQQTI